MKHYLLKTMLLGTSALLASTGTSFAQADHNGNGGGSVVCINPSTKKIISAESLDLWENEKLTLDTNLSGNEYQILDTLIQKIERLDPLRAEHLRNVLKNYLSLVHFESQRRLEKKNDFTTPYKTLDENCNIYTAAFFRNDEDETQYKYVIDNNIWTAMKPVHRAALLLHELLYSIERENGVTNSDGIRAQLRLFFSKQFLSWSLEKVNQYLFNNSELAIESTQAFNGTFKGAPKFFKDSNIVENGKLISPKPFKLKNGLMITCSGDTIFNSDGNPMDCSKGKYNIQSPFFAENFTVDYEGDETYAISTDRIEFSGPYGLIQVLGFSNYGNNSIIAEIDRKSGRVFRLKASVFASFVSVQSPTTIPSDLSSTIATHLTPDQSVSFDPSGFIKQVYGGSTGGFIGTRRVSTSEGIYDFYPESFIIKSATIREKVVNCSKLDAMLQGKEDYELPDGETIRARGCYRVQVTYDKAGKRVSLSKTF